MIVCPTCAKQNQDHYKFCLGCGAKIPDPALKPTAAPPALPPPPETTPPDHVVKTTGSVEAENSCSGCQQTNPPGFAFCGRCGNKLGSPSELVPQTAPDLGSARTVFAVSSPGGNDDAAPGGAPAPTPQARLVLLREDGSPGGVLVIEGGPENIGRNYGPPFDSDAYLDPEHAQFTVVPDGVLIDDRASLNGVYIKLVGKRELRDRDYFRVGQELLRYNDLPEPTTVADGTERMGSPNPGYWGRVEILATPDRAISAIPVEGTGLQIGRESGDLTFPDDGYVSGSHCRIIGDDAGVHIEDLGSSNGTYLRVRSTDVVPHGSMILIGQQLFRLDAG